MNKIIIIIITLAIESFAVEFILGGKRAQKDTLEFEADSSIYIDSAEVSTYEGIRGQTITGQRSRANIMRGIDKNSNAIRKEYNSHIIQGNKLSGGIIVRFKIVSSGSVIECKIVQSDLNDAVFEKNVVLTVKRWKFPEIEIENDTTIVEYPFVFGQVW